MTLTICCGKYRFSIHIPHNIIKSIYNVIRCCCCCSLMMIRIGSSVSFQWMLIKKGLIWHEHWARNNRHATWICCRWYSAYYAIGKRLKANTPKVTQRDDIYISPNLLCKWCCCWFGEDRKMIFLLALPYSNEQCLCST